MVGQALTTSLISQAGDTFTMRMHDDEMGDYEITKHVIDYQPKRRIAWEPVLTAASRPEDQADIGDRSHHRRIYELTPDGPDATIVTETYDCTRAPEWPRRAMKNGQHSMTATTVTLENSTSNATGCRRRHRMDMIAARADHPFSRVAAITKLGIALR